MDIATIIGIVSGFALMVIGIFWGGGVIDSFIDESSIVITLGGTIAATFVAYTVKDIGNIFKVVGNAFRTKAYDLTATISTIIDLANTARKEGLLALEEVVRQVDDPFLQKGIMLIVDGTDPELVKGIMEAEMTFIESRHQKGQTLLEDMGTYAPAMGMLGTLIGLINMLKNLSSPDTLGAGMATALVTTFYGSILANILFIPLASKLKQRSADEMLHKELMLEGMLSIQAGENPRIIEEKLFSFLPRAAKENASAAGDQEA